MDVQTLIDGAAKALAISADDAAMVVVRDVDTCMRIVVRKRGLFMACGNCPGHHDYYGLEEGACEYLLALWNAETAEALCDTNAPMGVLACKGCSALGCERCCERGWFYPEGDARAASDEERIEKAPPLKPGAPKRHLGNEANSPAIERAKNANTYEAARDRTRSLVMDSARRKSSVKGKHHPAFREPRANRFSAPCHACGTTVGEMEGILIPPTVKGEKWKVACRACDRK